MKKIISAVFVVMAIFAFTSCNKDELMKIDVPYSPKKIDFSIDSATVSGAKGEVQLFETILNVNIDSILSANKAGDLNAASLEKAIISLAAGQNLDYSWINSMRITMETSNIPEKNIAEISVIDKNLPSITLNTNSMELKDHFSNKSFTLRVYGNLSGPVPASIVKMEMELKFILGVDLL